MPTTRKSALVDWVAFGKWVTQQQGSMSDRELARQSGLSATHIGDIKKGNTGVKDETLSALVHALGVTEADARRAMGLSHTALTDEERELLDAMHRVPQHERGRFLSIVKATGQALAVCY